MDVRLSLLAPPRLVAGLLYLQHAYRLSDEAVVARWVENPYYQHLTSEAFVGKTVPRTVF